MPEAARLSTVTLRDKKHNLREIPFESGLVPSGDLPPHDLCLCANKEIRQRNPWRWAAARVSSREDVLTIGLPTNESGRGWHIINEQTQPLEFWLNLCRLPGSSAEFSKSDYTDSASVGGNGVLDLLFGPSVFGLTLVQGVDNDIRVKQNHGSRVILRNSSHDISNFNLEEAMLFLTSARLFLFGGAGLLRRTR